jgi:hypothetical protein
MSIYNSIREYCRRYGVLLGMKKEVRIQFRVDEEKAVRIAERLLDQFYGGKGFFEGYSMPEYVLPRNLQRGSREHALYLTYVISVDYMTDAE